MVKRELNLFIIFLAPINANIFAALHSCGCASTEPAKPGQEMSAKAIYERAIHLNVTAKVSCSMGFSSHCVQHCWKLTPVTDSPILKKSEPQMPRYLLLLGLHSICYCLDNGRWYRFLLRWLVRASDSLKYHSKPSHFLSSVFFSNAVKWYISTRTKTSRLAMFYPTDYMVCDHLKRRLSVKAYTILLLSRVACAAPKEGLLVTLKPTTCWYETRNLLRAGASVYDHVLLRQCAFRAYQCPRTNLVSTTRESEKTWLTTRQKWALM